MQWCIDICNVTSTKAMLCSLKLLALQELSAPGSGVWLPPLLLRIMPIWYIMLFINLRSFAWQRTFLKELEKNYFLLSKYFASVFSFLEPLQTFIVGISTDFCFVQWFLARTPASSVSLSVSPSKGYLHDGYTLVLSQQLKSLCSTSSSMAFWLVFSLAQSKPCCSPLTSTNPLGKTELHPQVRTRQSRVWGHTVITASLFVCGHNEQVRFHILVTWSLFLSCLFLVDEHECTLCRCT